MTTKRIIVSPVFPPIPMRQFDYCATRDGYQGGDPIGYGASPALAIDDLLLDEGENE